MSNAGSGWPNKNRVWAAAMLLIPVIPPVIELLIRSRAGFSASTWIGFSIFVLWSAFLVLAVVFLLPSARSGGRGGKVFVGASLTITIFGSVIPITYSISASIGAEEAPISLVVGASMNGTASRRLAAEGPKAFRGLLKWNFFHRTSSEKTVVAMATTPRASRIFGQGFGFMNLSEDYLELMFGGLSLSVARDRGVVGFALSPGPTGTVDIFMLYSPASIQFDHNTWKIADAGKAKNTLRNFVSQQRYCRLLVIGHHDISGEESFNGSIALGRANLIRSVIVELNASLYGKETRVQVPVGAASHMFGFFKECCVQQFVPDAGGAVGDRKIFHDDLLKELELSDSDLGFDRDPSGSDSHLKKFQKEVSRPFDDFLVELLKHELTSEDMVAMSSMIERGDMNSLKKFWRGDSDCYVTTDVSGLETERCGWNTRTRNEKTSIVEHQNFRTVVIVGVVGRNPEGTCPHTESK